MNLGTVVARALPAMLLAWCVNASATSAYSVTSLGTRGGGVSFAHAINSTGQIAGAVSNAAGQWEGFVLVDGQMRAIGTLGGQHSVAIAINGSGTVAGQSLSTDGRLRAIEYHDGSMVDIAPERGDASAYGINDSGWIVGSVEAGPARTMSHAFVSRAGQLDILGAIGGPVSIALDVNERGHIVGRSTTSFDQGGMHAFLYADGLMADLGTLGGVESSAAAVNNRAQVVGTSSAADGAKRAFLYQEGSMTDLGTLGGSWAEAFGINDHGEVVGWSGSAGGMSHAFLHRGGSMVDLNTLIDARLGWTISDARGINNAGQIAANGFNSITGAYEALLLTPIPEPSRLSLFVGGMLMIGLLTAGSRSRQ